MRSWPAATWPALAWIVAPVMPGERSSARNRPPKAYKSIGQTSELSFGGGLPAEPKGVERRTGAFMDTAPHGCG